MNKIDKIFYEVFNLKNLKNLNKVTFKNTKKWDSLSHVKFIVALEKAYKIKIDDEDAMNILSYKDSIKYLNRINEK